MKQITEAMINEERQRMHVELELFGRFLLYGEREAFWKAQKPKRQLSQRLLSAVRQHWPFKNVNKEPKL